jgi:RHS repeat-associated protein
VIGDTQAKKYWYHTDQVGSVKAVTNQAGAVVWNADYLPFGQQYVKSKLDESFEEDDLGFTGKGYDSDIGLSYFNARWYDADMGRFISEDPVADPNNPNLYSYCRNNPLRFTDPTGLESENPGNISTVTSGGNYGYNNGSGGVPSPPKGGPSWVIPGAMESRDNNGNPIWIWGNLTNGIFTPSSPMSSSEIKQLLLQNSYVNGVYCQTPGDLEGPYGVHLRNIELISGWISESEAENKTLEEDRAELGLEQVNFRFNRHIYNTGLTDPISGLPILAIAVGPNQTSNFFEDFFVQGINSQIGKVRQQLSLGIMPFGPVGEFGVEALIIEREGLNFSYKALEHMREPGRAVPIQTLKDAINSTKGVPDPRGSSALMHYAEMTKNGVTYTLEVLYDAVSKTVYHFMYYR